MGSDEIESLVGYFVVLFDEEFELSTTNKEILIGESIGNVPSNWSELTSVLHLSLIHI